MALQLSPVYTKKDGAFQFDVECAWKNINHIKGLIEKDEAKKDERRAAANYGHTTGYGAKLGLFEGRSEIYNELILFYETQIKEHQVIEREIE